MRRFTFVTLAPTASVAFLVGAILGGGVGRSTGPAGPNGKTVAPATRASTTSTAIAPAINFADVVERINPAVVNIDATARGEGRRRRGRTSIPDPPDGPFDF